MAAGGGGVCHEDASGADLYGVLGLKKECSDADLRLAYRKLAMTWHPDRCSASGSSARVEEAKERFQEIQGAYSVLSDSGKRLLYDVGVYDSDDDDSGQDEQDVSGMGDFLGEMAEMMSQATPTVSFEELQQLFVDMFHGDLVGGFGFGFEGPPPMVHRAQAQSPPCSSGSASAEASPSCDAGNKRCSSAMGSGTPRGTAARSGSGPSGLSSKGSDLRRPEEAPWTQEEDTSTGGVNKKQRLSTRRSHGVSSSSEED